MGRGEQRWRYSKTCSCGFPTDAASRAARGGDAVIVLDPASPVPPFEQVKDQIATARASGEMAPGHRLPPVRALAAELGLAPNTVARAYRELEASGVIETRGRSGSFIAGRTDQLDAAAEAARRYVAEARRLGVVPETALRLVRAAMDERP